MANRLLKVGVIGCGYVAQNGHIPVILKCKNVKLVALCDKNEELATSIARKFRIGKYYTDSKEMLDRGKLDVVNICTPISTHGALAIQAMEAGCHVFVEKPLAINIEEADQMITASKKNQVKLSVMQNWLFLPTVMKMKSLVDRRAIGDLVRVEIKQSFPPQSFPIIADPNHWWHKLPGGVFGDAIVHPIYLARAFLGDIEPIAVYPVKSGKVKQLSHMKFDEVQVILQGKKGMGTIISSCNWPDLLSIDIFGTERNIHGNLNNSYVVIYGGKTNMGQGLALQYGVENLKRSLQILGSTLSIAIKMLLGRHRGVPAAISQFYESIQNSTEPPVTAEDGREVLRIWEKITSQMV